MIEYCVPECDPETWYELKENKEGDYPPAVARACAEEYFVRHDGRESSWPLVFWIRTDGGIVSKFDVEMYLDPVFSAVKAKEDIL